MNKSEIIEEYLSKDYAVLLTRDPESHAYVLEIPDWPGCITHAETREEAFRKLEEAKYTWIEDCLERGIQIPEPRPAETFSGRLLLRMAKSLHRRLVELAQREGVSLNAYLGAVLSEHVGRRSAHTEPPRALERVVVFWDRRHRLPPQAQISVSNTWQELPTTHSSAWTEDAADPAAQRPALIDSLLSNSCSDVDTWRDQHAGRI